MVRAPRSSLIRPGFSKRLSWVKYHGTSNSRPLESEGAGTLHIWIRARKSSLKGRPGRGFLANSAILALIERVIPPGRGINR